MDTKIILNVLKRWNIWESNIGTGIVREKYIQEIYPYLDRKEVLVLKGIRRSGKSTIMLQLMKELVKRDKVDKGQLLYLNLEDHNFAQNLEISLFDDVLKFYQDHTKNKKMVYFFIDEIQKIPGWERWIRTKYDLQENIKFIVSGSSASLLSKELSTLLTGRNLSFVIRPLSFNEVLSFDKDISLQEYIRFGGFPEVVLEKSSEKKLKILQQYFDDIVHKDIIDRYEIRNTKQLLNLARYLVSVAGAKVSINKLSKTFGISKDSIANYINYLTDAYLLFEVPFFSFSAKVKHDVARLPKLYVLDNGLINVVEVKYSQNEGQMFENTVLIKLLENFKEVNYWSDADSEVDFVVEGKAINVTATDKIPAREWKGLEEFKKRHKQFSLLLVTKSMDKENAISMNKFMED
ncbi:ATP-binding protein [Candidatus Woesearchaeota archaeon]|nr:ATP-binding protein [Candidatus Woesearchaeota archaeon]